MLVDKCFETLVSGDVFPDSWQLLTRNVFGEVAPIVFLFLIKNLRLVLP
jgi:hypothetical protein